MISLTVPGTPVSVNTYTRHCVIGGKIRRYKTRESKVFAQDLAIIASGQQLRCKFGYDVRYKVFHAKGERGDVDNRAKVILDALVAAGVIDTDSKVIRCVAEKSRDWDNPRTEITVRPYREQLEQ
jgi:Holliday junction resolvase RusA-like endonuclease